MDCGSALRDQHLSAAFPGLCSVRHTLSSGPWHAAPPSLLRVLHACSSTYRQIRTATAVTTPSLKQDYRTPMERTENCTSSFFFVCNYLIGKPATVSKKIGKRGRLFRRLPTRLRQQQASSNLELSCRGDCDGESLQFSP